MSTFQPRIPLPAGQTARRIVQQADGKNATRTIISRPRVQRSAVWTAIPISRELAARTRGGRPLAGPGGGAHMELAPRSLWRLSAQRWSPPQGCTWRRLRDGQSRAHRGPADDISSSENAMVSRCRFGLVRHSG